jgi:hypothetical protein|tara:strand:+ start:1847 stop:2293 length:447 start_codon:yes stop_codon:yes gene_type:complete
MEFNKNYHNNEFNFLISELTDRQRSIMDIDCSLSKYGSNLNLLVDHKKSNDKVSINTVRMLSTFADVKLNNRDICKCFIVRSEIDTKLKKTTSCSVVYEIKNYAKVKDKTDISSFIEQRYTITNDKDLKLFFQPETHLQTKIKLKDVF